MQFLMMKDLPRYECLLEAAREFPDMDPSASEAFLNLLRSGDEAIRVVAAQLGQHDITQGRFAVLMALWMQCRRVPESSFLSPAELAERTGVTRATMTGLIDTLLRDGLVTRKPHPDDRRMLCVGLTEKGHAALTRILPQHFRQMAWLMQPLTEAERRTLVALLTKIQQRAAERPSENPPDESSATAAG